VGIGHFTRKEQNVFDEPIPDAAIDLVAQYLHTRSTKNYSIPVIGSALV
jgi:hypothetical protein